VYSSDNAGIEILSSIIISFGGSLPGVIMLGSPPKRDRPDADFQG
jgi:hypothetical protein